MMTRLATLGPATALVLILTACKQPDTHDIEVTTIQGIESQWNLDYMSRDPEKLITHYADDAVLIVPGMPASNGKSAIHNSLKAMVADPALSVKFQPSRVEVAKSGDVAYTVGTYTITFTDPQTRQVIHDRGNYVTTYRKQPDGTWKAVADISTSEVPPPAPQPTPPAAKQPTPRR
jgi:uncharacterized protein (TIGR02246 family)